MPLLNSEDNDSLLIDFTLNNNKPLSFEELMLIDIEKGIRKDLKLKLKKNNKL